MTIEQPAVNTTRYIAQQWGMTETSTVRYLRAIGYKLKRVTRYDRETHQSYKTYVEHELDPPLPTNPPVTV